MIGKGLIEVYMCVKYLNTWASGFQFFFWKKQKSPLARNKLKNDWAYAIRNNISLAGHMGLDVTKPVFEVSDKSRFKLVSSATETS